MKVLQLCTKPLFAPYDGGKIAMRTIADGLKHAGHEVVQWMISTPRHPWPKHIPQTYPFELHHHVTDTRVTLSGALKNLFSRSSYNLERFQDNAATALQVEWLKKHPVDLIQAESIYALTGLKEFRKATNAPIFLRAHNVEYLIWERMAEQCRNPLKKAYLQLLSRRLKRTEITLCNACDGVVVMSENDASLFRASGVNVPITVIGIATQLKPDRKVNALEKKQIYHLGAMDWLPNREGVEWFIQKIWPEIHRALPDWRLVLAGKHMPEMYFSMTSHGIRVHDAEDAAVFMQTEGIMIVPLLSGSGIRVKIIEGLALGSVIITTPIGLEGIPANDGVEVLVAHEPTDFLRILLELIASPDRAQRISENALTFANEHFRNEVLTSQLLHFYQTRSSPV